MIIDDPFGRARNGTMAELVLAPVESAPVRPGQGFGPCLLGAGPNGEWAIGHWDGYGWYNNEGTAISPIVWAPLPPIGEIMTAVRPTTLAGAIAVLEQVGNDEDQIHPEAIRNVVVFLKELAGRQAVRDTEP